MNKFYLRQLPTLSDGYISFELIGDGYFSNNGHLSYGVWSPYRDYPDCSYFFNIGDGYIPDIKLPNNKIIDNNLSYGVNIKMRPGFGVVGKFETNENIQQFICENLEKCTTEELEEFMNEFGLDREYFCGYYKSTYSDDYLKNLIIRCNDKKPISTLDRVIKNKIDSKFSVGSYKPKETYYTSKKTRSIHRYGGFGPASDNGEFIKFYNDGRLHCDNGPSIINKLTKQTEYYINGTQYSETEYYLRTNPGQLNIDYITCENDDDRLFLENHLNSTNVKFKEDKPTQLIQEGNIIHQYYFTHGNLHRVDGPAKISIEKDSKKETSWSWYYHGKLDRVKDRSGWNEPTCYENNNDVEEFKWFNNDLLHNASEPAIVIYDKKTNRYNYLAWYRRGALHSLYGPALIKNISGNEYIEQFWINGNQYSEEEYYKHPAVICTKLSGKEFDDFVKKLNIPGCDINIEITDGQQALIERISKKLSPRPTEIYLNDLREEETKLINDLNKSISNGQSAIIRIFTKRIINTTQNIIINILSQSSIDKSVITIFMSSPIGYSIICYIVGLLLGKMDNKYVKLLAKEARVESISEAGNELVKMIIGEIIHKDEEINSYIFDIKEHETEVDFDHVQINRRNAC